MYGVYFAAIVYSVTMLRFMHFYTGKINKLLSVNTNWQYFIMKYILRVKTYISIVEALNIKQEPIIVHGIHLRMYILHTKSHWTITYNILPRPSDLPKSMRMNNVKAYHYENYIYVWQQLWIMLFVRSSVDVLVITWQSRLLCICIHGVEQWPF